eukprot:3195984-Pyramimonas_sp.AAC.1
MLSLLQRGVKTLRHSGLRPSSAVGTRYRQADFHGEVSASLTPPNYFGSIPVKRPFTSWYGDIRLDSETVPLAMGCQWAARNANRSAMDRCFTAEEVQAYAKLGGDTNSIHICPVRVMLQEMVICKASRNISRSPTRVAMLRRRLPRPRIFP